MRLAGDAVDNEPLTADEEGVARKIVEEAVIIAAALSEAAAPAVKRDAGDDGEADLRGGDERAACLRFQNAVSALFQIVVGADHAKVHPVTLPAARNAERFAVRPDAAQQRLGVDFQLCADKGEHDPGFLIVRVRHQVAADRLRGEFLIGGVQGARLRAHGFAQLLLLLGKFHETRPPAAFSTV